MRNIIVYICNYEQLAEDGGRITWDETKQMNLQ